MSQWGSILDAGGSLVQAVTTTTVVIRRSGQTLPSDTFPMWLVCAFAEENPVEYAFTNLVHYDYPVAYLFIAAHDRDFSHLGQAAWLTEREAVRAALDVRTLSGVSTVWDAELGPLPTSSYTESDNTVYDVTGFIVTYSTWETR